MTMRYIPIRPGFGKAILAANVDMGLGFLPFFILEIIIVQFNKQFLDSLIKVAARFKGSSWEKIIEGDPDRF